MAKIKASKNVTGLIRLLTVLTFVSGIAIIALAGAGMHRILSNQVISVAEKEAILIGRLLVDQQHEILFTNTASGKHLLNIESSYIEWLNESLSDFLQPFDIVKIKIFAPDTRVIYSTDNAIIGEMVPQNERLLRALSGISDSHLEVKDALRDLRNETAFDVDVVETYIPINIDGEILGVFELYMDVTQFRADIRGGTLKSLALLSMILLVVCIIAFSIAGTGMKQVAAAEEKLRQQAMIDALTGIFNRGELISRAEAEVARIIRHGATDNMGQLSLLMLDIDHFKQVNDRYGHQTGDEVLRQMPVRIKQELRLYDVLGRYGGEEFMILLPNADLDDACIVAERIRSNIAAKPFSCKPGEIPVTVSIGVSTILADIELEQAIKFADDALYRAKQNGRNRYEKHQTL